MTTRRAGRDEPADETLALIMAGGQGARLADLTRWHSKPALPFGGQYRNIDFALSNCVNSGIRRIGILTQYMAHSLIQHVHRGWTFFAPELGEFIEIWPAQQRRGAGWYAGTADAVHQNVDLIESAAPERVLVLAGDHVYKMDYAAMLETHRAAGADVTVGCVEVPLAEAGGYGVVGVDGVGRILRFDEKPRRPLALPSNPRAALASMGIYVFERAFLVERLEADAADPDSGHDFGHDILPRLIRDDARVHSHVFRDASGRPGYWRDVGTVDSYWRAHMELLTAEPGLDLHDEAWPLWTHPPRSAPSRFVGEGSAHASIVSAACSVAGSVERSVLSTGCRVASGASLTQCVVLPDAEIGRDCRVRRAIVDSGCRIPDGLVIGEDLLTTAECYQVSDNGIVLVTAEMVEAAQQSRRGDRRVA